MTNPFKAQKDQQEREASARRGAAAGQTSKSVIQPQLVTQFDPLVRVVLTELLEAYYQPTDSGTWYGIDVGYANSRLRWTIVKHYVLADNADGATGEKRLSPSELSVELITGDQGGYRFRVDRVPGQAVESDATGEALTEALLLIYRQ